MFARWKGIVSVIVKLLHKLVIGLPVVDSWKEAGNFPLVTNCLVILLQQLHKATNKCNLQFFHIVNAVLAFVVHSRKMKFLSCHLAMVYIYPREKFKYFNCLLTTFSLLWDTVATVVHFYIIFTLLYVALEDRGAP